MISEAIREHLADMLLYATQPSVDMTLNHEAHTVTIRLSRVSDAHLETLSEMVQDALRERSL